MQVVKCKVMACHIYYAFFFNLAKITKNACHKCIGLFVTVLYIVLEHLLRKHLTLRTLMRNNHCMFTGICVDQIWSLLSQLLVQKVPRHVLIRILYNMTLICLQLLDRQLFRSCHPNACQETTLCQWCMSLKRENSQVYKEGYLVSMESNREEGTHKCVMAREKARQETTLVTCAPLRHDFALPVVSSSKKIL